MPIEHGQPSAFLGAGCTCAVCEEARRKWRENFGLNGTGTRSGSGTC